MLSTCSVMFPAFSDGAGGSSVFHLQANTAGPAVPPGRKAPPAEGVGYQSPALVRTMGDAAGAARAEGREAVGSSGRMIEVRFSMQLHLDVLHGAAIVFNRHGGFPCRNCAPPLHSLGPGPASQCQGRACAAVGSEGGAPKRRSSHATLDIVHKPCHDAVYALTLSDTRVYAAHEPAGVLHGPCQSSTMLYPWPSAVVQPSLHEQMSYAHVPWPHGFVIPSLYGTPL